MPLFVSSGEDCDAEMFKCKDGTCLTKDKICDGPNDCGEGEDEADCPPACNYICCPWI